MRRSSLALLSALWLLGVWPIVEIVLWGNHGPMGWLFERLPVRVREFDPYLGLHMPAVGGLASLGALLRLNSAAAKPYGPVPFALKVALFLMTAFASLCWVAGLLLAAR